MIYPRSDLLLSLAYRKSSESESYQLEVSDLLSKLENGFEEATEIRNTAQIVAGNENGLRIVNQQFNNTDSEEQEEIEEIEKSFA